ncbi:Putative glycoside hydrolase family 17, glycoside hydrolase superfamily [Septoria linicola]|uniref:glucan endo-1,3-beta-D-glucosidase n=1 Tax=Septoria linicola TaxID=215465 RepID=A0A9Q9AUM7_9PEZI|nr:putative glycoside hydrolase family 17, glycoside hydrolase superfamily [Septoria linicola]USW52438.1 Putative glycoside hydrolase family 17, glycoside hydrolase superfamily [Septoria linicola]
MSERQYGIPMGHVHGAPLQQQARTPASPGDALGYPSQAGNDSHALRDIDHLYNQRMSSPSPDPYQDVYGHGAPPPPPHMQRPVSSIQQHSQSSLAPLTANQGMGYSPTPSSSRSFHYEGSAMPAGTGAGLGAGGVEYGQQLPRGHSYYGDGYDSFDPSTIEDDGDDGIQERQRPRSRLGFGAAAGAGAAASAGAGIGMKSLNRDSSGIYGPVGHDAEKSEWLSKQTERSGRKKKWIIGCSIAAILVIGGIIGGVVGGILANQKDEDDRNGSGSNSGSSSGLYDINSRQVKAVMNDDRLHKVFPTVDYTPFYAQYPACLSPGGGPDQNNVTLDIARLSQLAPAVRLYGTDCNQTELVLEAIDRLEMQDTMKVWLGVYLDGNSTTNDRQLKDLYNILDNYPHDRFVGVIVGNEVLFAKTWTITDLATQLDEVRSNFTSRGINLPVATADLGDNWDANLAQASDIVMSNIHPFFAGTLAEDSASWAWSFWQDKDVALTSAKTGTVGSVTYPKQIISEIGWPTQGGNDCGVADDPAYGCTSDTDGAVASLDNLNTFMDGWVCDAMTNGTTYFWFEAFDEPWKHQFDTEHNKWEPYWGLFDKDRNLKKGLKIPDCGGKTIDKPY